MQPNRTFVIVALVFCASATIVLALLSPIWIESWFGVDPDGGNGLLETVLIGSSVMAGLGLGILLCKPSRRTASALHAGETLSARKLP